MSSQVILVAFGLWLLFCAWRGFAKGVWVGVFSLLGLFTAYVVSFLYGREFASILETSGVFPEYSTLIAYPLLFFVVTQAVRHLPFLCFPKLKSNRGLSAWAGAALGTMTGVVSGLVVIWVISFVVDMRHSQTSTASVKEEESPIQELAASVVGKAVEIGVSAASKDATQANAIGALLKDPAPMVKNAQSLMQSSEAKAFFRDTTVQQQLDDQDVVALSENPLFLSLSEKPELDNLMGALSGGSEDTQLTNIELAQKMTYVWQRVQQVKDDPELIKLMSDSEVQSTLQSGNTFAVMTNPKVQKLLALVVDKGMAEPLTDGSSQGVRSPESVKTQADIYRWRDNDGKVQYSDWEHIPQDKRAGAELFK